MQPHDSTSSGPGARRSPPGGPSPVTPLGGTMAAPPNRAADTFAEEMALGTEQPSISPTDRVREDLAVERSSPATTPGASNATATSAVASTASEARDKVSSAVSTVTDKAPAAAGKVKGWVSEHPLVAVGAGLIGGILLGSGGGSQHHHHHYHGEGDPQRHESAGDGSSGGQHRAGGIAGLIQQTGAFEIVAQSAERFMKMTNDQASDALRQRLPGFDEQLRQKRAPVAQSTDARSPVRMASSTSERHSVG